MHLPTRIAKLRKFYPKTTDLMPQWWRTEERDERFFDRMICMLDLYELAKYILGYKDMTPFHKGLCKIVQEINIFFIHKALSDMLAKCKTPLVRKEIEGAKAEASRLSYGVDRERMFLIFRGGFKTSIITEAHSIQLALIDPNIRLLIASGNMNMATKILRNIKYPFMYNESFRYLFPEYCPTPNKNGTIDFGTTESITLPNRWIPKREGTFDTAGLETRKAGGHWDMLKKDDIVSEQNVTNEEMLKKTDEFDQLSLSLFDKPAFPIQDYIGTRYHSIDLYGKIQERNADDNGNIKIITFNGKEWFKKDKKVA